MQLTTCLWFGGNAREAAEFYVSIFPESTLGDNWTSPADTATNDQGSEVVVNFRIFGQPFIGLNASPKPDFSESISFQIPCVDQYEIDRYWELLTANGGEAVQCGWLKDKFGVSWQVVSPQMDQYIGGPNPAGAEAATKAMVAMTKIDLEGLRLAYESGLASDSGS